MEENFVGYLLDALDERTKLQVESYLGQHPEAYAKLALLQQALAVLEADLEAPKPPAYLVERTLAKVAAQMCAGKEPTEELPLAPSLSRANFTGGRSWWRRADLMVAASLLITVTGIGLMVLQRMQGPSSSALVVECKNNLREFFSGLQAYRDLKGQFPDMSQEAPRDVAGMVVPILHDAGTLPSIASIRCPAVGVPLTPHRSLEALRNLSDAEFAQLSPCLSMCYAYSLGYRDEDGTYHAPGNAPKPSWSQLPIMADRPPSEGILSNSVNHDGAGQNVLFTDGHVAFLPNRTFGAEDDIFLNRDNKVAAGRDASDIVLGYSAARP